MKIAIVGTGYVGLVTGTCFAEMGTEVYCVDIDAAKIENLKKGVMPIYEPGLEEMVIRNHKEGRLHFITELKDIINEVDVLFSAVGTPPGEDGSADLKYVLDVARSVGKYMEKYILVVTKSTVPVGTAGKVKQAIREEQVKRGLSIDFDIASNPEFLKEGAAIKDFMTPDRVVVGVETEKAKDLMARLYRPFMLNNFRVIFMDIPSAEMTKYAANAMLATRISFMNDIANLCELVGADANMVRKGIGSDNRIGSRFLYPGCGYGGSCFPKDVKALIKTAYDYHYPMRILQAVEDVNAEQKQVLFKKLITHFHGVIKGRKIAVWGLSFKPETDDIREAPSLALIERLLESNCRVAAYDPVAMPEAEKILGNRIEYGQDIYDVLDGADALLIVTEWKVFRMPSWNVVRKLMNDNLILDGRNLYDKKELEAFGFIYKGIGQ
ncbi:MAG: UDP-glucose/GDP-mannose dehydrogenase family protein [Tannerellaceae bacterium]|jgi:UDPglucose 6-dehydrogenase|nr:UDP-glucose/GDP-mannose dehydrogenase family protein [Tannerellaceae bacterium]